MVVGIVNGNGRGWASGRIVGESRVPQLVLVLLVGGNEGSAELQEGF